MELSALNVVQRTKRGKYFPSEGEAWNTVLDIVLNESVRYEVFGYVSSQGYFIQANEGPENPSAPSVTRDWPSREFGRFQGNPPSCAIHTHPFNRARRFDPPTIADVCVFLSFALSSRMFRWPKERKHHFVFTRTGLYTLGLRSGKHLEVMERACWNQPSLERCERSLFDTVKRVVHERVEAPLLSAFGSEGYTGIDQIASASRTSIMQSKERMIRYLQIIQENAAVTLCFEEFIR